MTENQLRKRIAYYLNKTKLRHEDIAKVLDIPRNAMSAIIKYEREVSAYEALKICQILNVQPNELLNWKGDDSFAEETA